MPRTSRRGEICRAAIALAAAGGNHGVTHQGIDAHLGISRGSTSYYYRSRGELISAVAGYLSAESREEFDRAIEGAAPGQDGAEARNSAVIDDYMERLANERREACRARMALLLDPACGDEQREALAHCLFSREGAVALCAARGEPDPEAAATTMIDELEGRVARLTIFAPGPDTGAGTGTGADAGTGAGRE